MKHLLVLLLLLCSMSVSAQDVIVKKDGSTVVCRVVEVTATEITYKKWSDLNGSNYVMDKSMASAINYENGKKETFSKTESLYKPNNQNDGEQAMNDKALLRLDYAASNPYKKVKTLKTLGWIGGGALLVTGGILYAVNADRDSKAAAADIAICSIGALAWGSSFYLIANLVKRNTDKNLVSTTIMQYDFPFSNGSSLTLGTDLIRDNTLGRNTIGLGLRYNF